MSLPNWNWMAIGATAAAISVTVAAIALIVNIGIFFAQTRRTKATNSIANLWQLRNEWNSDALEGWRKKAAHEIKGPDAWKSEFGRQYLLEGNKANHR